MKYHILFTNQAQKAAKKLPKNIWYRIKKQILQLQINPRPNNCKKLINSLNYYRIRIGNYRVIYEIQDTVRIIFIIRIAHRKDIYRK